MSCKLNHEERKVVNSLIDESLEILLSTQLPGCRSVASPETSRKLATVDQNHVSSIIDSTKLSWLVKSFVPYKSPGPIAYNALCCRKRNHALADKYMSFHIDGERLSKGLQNNQYFLVSVKGFGKTSG